MDQLRSRPGLTVASERLDDELNLALVAQPIQVVRGHAYVFGDFSQRIEAFPCDGAMIIGHGRPIEW